MRHAPNRRLKLWPSAAERWVNCSGSPLVQEIADAHRPSSSSDAAREGTMAHAELSARLTGKSAKSFLWKTEEPFDLPDDQLKLLDEVAEEIKFFAMMGGYEVQVEQGFKIRFGGHTMNCRIDVLLVNDRNIAVLDYKHGVRHVNHIDNPQLELYALAARGTLPGRNMSVGILQPRGMGDGLSLHPIPNDHLDKLATTFAAGVARCYSPAPSAYCPGPWCQYCPGLEGYCPEILKRIIEAFSGVLGREDVAEGATPPPPWWLLDGLEQMQKYLKGIDQAATDALKRGETIPGWELVESWGRRKWADPEEAPAVLAEIIGCEIDAVRRIKESPIGITEAQKLAKKAKADISSLIDRPTVLKRVKSTGQDSGSGFDKVE